jgi:hypothetical protein
MSSPIYYGSKTLRVIIQEIEEEGWKPFIEPFSPASRSSSSIP